MKFLVDKSVNVPMSALNVLIRYPNEYVSGPVLKGSRRTVRRKWKLLFGSLAGALVATGL